VVGSVESFEHVKRSEELLIVEPQSLKHLATDHLTTSLILIVLPFWRIKEYVVPTLQCMAEITFS